MSYKVTLAQHTHIPDQARDGTKEMAHGFQGEEKKMGPLSTVPGGGLFRPNGNQYFPLCEEN